MISTVATRLISFPCAAGALMLAAAGGVAAMPQSEPQSMAAGGKRPAETRARTAALAPAQAVPVSPTQAVPVSPTPAVPVSPTSAVPVSPTPAVPLAPTPAAALALALTQAAAVAPAQAAAAQAGSAAPASAAATPSAATPAGDVPANWADKPAAPAALIAPVMPTAPAATSKTISDAVRATLAEERAAALTADREAPATRRYSTQAPPNQFEAFAEQFDEARVPDCLHADALKRQPTFIFGGLLALPFVAVAKLRGKCN